MTADEWAVYIAIAVLAVCFVVTVVSGVAVWRRFSAAIAAVGVVQEEKQ